MIMAKKRDHIMENPICQGMVRMRNVSMSIVVNHSVVEDIAGEAVVGMMNIPFE